MSNEELSISDATLIERLRLYGSKFHHEFGHNDAADRIEALLAERKKDHANINLKADFIDKTLNQLAEAEAKLAVVVGALDKIASGIFNGQLLMSMPPKDPAAEYARATLAEISSEAALNKGESHDPL